MTLETGALLHNRYRIEQTIAQGGMGAIYRAIDESLSVSVAVKENLFTTEEYSRQFRREATILAGLRHPNLPRVTDHFVLENQGQYLVMDFIEGEDLKQRTTRLGILSETEAVTIGVAICDALIYLHNRTNPIVHRDIKPGNVKITPAGQVYLVDFGLAKISHSGQATTIGAQALTPGYAPPEQYGKGTDLRSDIYALGATLYAVLSNTIPEDALARAMGSAALTPLRRLNGNISERLAAVIEKAMSVEPGHRFQNAEEFKEALLDANSTVRRKSAQSSELRVDPATAVTMIGSAPPPTVQASTDATAASHHVIPQTVAGRQASVPPPPPPVVYPTSTPARTPVPSQPISRARKRKKQSSWVWIIPVALLLLALGAAVVAGMAYLANSGLVVAIQPTASPTSEEPLPEEVEFTETPVPENTETQPASTHTARPDKPTATVDRSTPTQAPSPTSPATSTPAITPVGGGQGLIAFASDRKDRIPQIWVMNPDGSNQHAITNSRDGACQPDWSPDGQKIVFISPCRARQDEYRGSSLFIMNADGSNIGPPINPMPGGDFDPVWSPDGKHIAFTSLRENIAHIYLYNIETRQIERLSRPSNYDRRPAWSPDGKMLAFESTRLGQMQIWTMELSGDRAQEFSTLAKGVSTMATWSPDGSSITFIQGKDSQLVWKQLANRLIPETPLGTRLNLASDVDYSPDGYWLTFESWRENGNHDVYIISANGGNLTRLTDDPGSDFQPAWRH